MAAPPAPAAPPATIHEAALAGGPSGAVIRGAEIDPATAIARRRAGQDVVICGDDTAVNRGLAQAIETAVGPWLRQVPHTRTAGPLALPHFQQKTPPPEGHCFYETDRRKARKNP